MRDHTNANLAAHDSRDPCDSEWIDEAVAAVHARVAKLLDRPAR